MKRGVNKMFLKIRCGQTTTIYEIDDIEYFSFSWYDFVDLEKKQTKEYLENIELLDKQQGKDPLYFVKQIYILLLYYKFHLLLRCTIN